MDAPFSKPEPLVYSEELLVYLEQLYEYSMELLMENSLESLWDLSQSMYPTATFNITSPTTP